MAEWITNLVQTLGYPGIAVLMLVESAFPPIPSEVIMPFAGMVAARGQLNFWLVVVVGSVASVLGTLPLYYLGHRVGLERIEAWADRYGRLLTLSGEDIRRAGDWFDRHPVTVLVCRLIPGIRALISIPAGARRMNFGVFLLYTTVGTTLWAALLTYMGLVLGQNYRMVERFIDPVTWAIFGAIAVMYVYRVVKGNGQPQGRRGRRRAEAG
jgi:membrane protein DedA with SNARE-associated domain